MLKLTRREGETVFIRLGGEMVAVHVDFVEGRRVRLGVQAPRTVEVYRGEVAVQLDGWKQQANELLDERARSRPSQHHA